jgi:L-seryl-tRNA(Ser) seleniumtransferase
LSGAATRAVVEALNGYSTLEYDLERGGRGSRLDRVEGILQRLTGAEGAVVVNNNAAALLLLLATLAKGKRVVVSRTQLVEIGGGFRVPDVMRQSGARMTEIGTTNRVHLQDYQRATEEPTALVLVAHRSNFRLVGFTEEPGLAEIVQLCKLRGVPLVYDLGSGALLDTAKYGLAHEPMVQEALRAGVDLVAFSADKLLGGPQAGIILGKAELVSAIKRHPMARALRADKTCLAALGATLVHYLRGEAAEQIPVWRMVALKPRQLRQRAEGMRRDLGKGEVIRGESAVGGGSLPGDTLPTYLLALPQSSPEKLMQALRFQSPPIIARTKDNRVLIDPRTILPGQEEMLLAGVRKALQEVAP